MLRRLPVPAAALVLAVAAAALAAPADVATWREDLAAWRTRASDGLKRERGWLSITGRWELVPGITKIGSGPGNDVVLPAELSPPSLGTIDVRGGKATLRLARGQSMQVVEKNLPGATFTERQVLPGDSRIELVTNGRLSLQFVKRDDGRLVMFENATHWVHHDETDAVNTLLSDFLR